MLSYCYVTSCWLYHDWIYWTIDSTFAATYIIPYWLISNFSVGTIGYQISEASTKHCFDATHNLIIEPFGRYAPLVTHILALNSPYSYAYVGSQLPNLNEFWNIFWYFDQINYFWWKGYIIWEDFYLHMWGYIHLYPYEILVIGDFYIYI